MKKGRIARCPYCGRRLNYFFLWDSKKSDIGTCNHCGGVFAVKYSFFAYFLFFLSIIALAVMFSFHYLANKSLPGLKYIALFILWFLFLHFFTPLLMKPRKCIIKGRLGGFPSKEAIPTIKRRRFFDRDESAYEPIEDDGIERQDEDDGENKPEEDNASDEPEQEDVRVQSYMQPDVFSNEKQEDAVKEASDDVSSASDNDEADADEDNTAEEKAVDKAEKKAEKEAEKEEKKAKRAERSAKIKAFLVSVKNGLKIAAVKFAIAVKFVAVKIAAFAKFVAAKIKILAKKLKPFAKKTLKVLEAVGLIVIGACKTAFVKSKNWIIGKVHQIQEFKKRKSDGSFEDVNEDAREESHAFDVADEDLEENESSKEDLPENESENESDDEIEKLIDDDGFDSEKI